MEIIGVKVASLLQAGAILSVTGHAHGACTSVKRCAADQIQPPGVIC
jgi:hypothetical protein